MWPFKKKQTARAAISTPIRLTNTLSGKKEEFLPPAHRPVRMYNCGPTVYAKQHIGNLSMFVFSDLLRKMLEYNGLKVKQVINITDVGHLTGDNEDDADQGEDRMSKALRAEGKKLTLENMKALGEKYTKLFLDDVRALGIPVEKIEFPVASDYIDAQIALIQTLEEKGYAYKSNDGVYFDTARFPDYGALGNIDIGSLQEGARVESKAKKRNPIDFALWKFDEKVGWESPWGKGFPGWHIECSAMIRSTLGEQIDIHTGGIEHIPVHHNNEIAQSEAAFARKPFSRFWIHRAHIQINSKKIAKSEGNVIYLSDITEAGFHPLAYRYWLLQGHYRTPMDFSWQALEAAHNARNRLLKIRTTLASTANQARPADAGSSGGAKPDEVWKRKFNEVINDDLNTPQALAIMWNMLEDTTLSDDVRLTTLLDFDRALGIGLAESSEHVNEIALSDLPDDVRDTINEREQARKEKNWKKADELRGKIQEAGFHIEDTENGPRITKN